MGATITGLMTLGQQATLNSIPVTFPSDVATLPVSAQQVSDLLTTGPLNGTNVSVTSGNNAGFGDSSAVFNISCQTGNTFTSGSVIQFEQSTDNVIYNPLVVYQLGLINTPGRTSYTGTTLSVGQSTSFWAPTRGIPFIRMRMSTQSGTDNGTGTIAISKGTGPSPMASNDGTIFNMSPTVSAASAYVAGQCVGGLLTLACQRANNASALLEHLVVSDHAAQNAALDIFFFNSIPAGTFTNHAAFPVLTQADNNLVIGVVSFLTTDYKTIASAGYATKSGINIMLASTGGNANIYVAISTSGTPTYPNTTDLQIRMGLLRN